MSTVIYPSPIFGPVHSRRLGVSLGINLLPADGKVCTFDCIYCECGFNADHRPRLRMPSRSEVAEALEARLKDMQLNGPTPDVLTFAGNGEPTANPEFPQIMDDTLRLRDKYFPHARVSVLSNATMVTRPEVHAALMRVDNNIQKLDTVSREYIKKVDRPTGHYDLEAIIEGLCAFQGHVIIQTMFLHGPGVSNVSDEYVNPWLQAIQRIAPRQVMIYTIDRETPDRTLSKATRDELDAIAARVQSLGIPCQASY
jgi:wyosine [tRNA(Phe)-imidazoG37] synthetase (radical SAM superfamily)